MKKAILFLILAFALIESASCRQKESPEIGKVIRKAEEQFIPEMPYTPEKAAADGDIVDQHGQISNLKRLDMFRQHISEGIGDKIRITIYTVEGSPVFYDLDYDGKMIQYTYDNSHGGYAGSGQRRESTTCSELVRAHEDGIVKYLLKGCSSDLGDSFYFTEPE